MIMGVEDDGIVVMNEDYRIYKIELSETDRIEVYDGNFRIHRKPNDYCYLP